MKFKAENIDLISRAVNDSWYFGILLDNGIKIAFCEIISFTEDDSGNVWINVNLSDREFEGYFNAPTSRKKCSINLSKICAIYELADT